MVTFLLLDLGDAVVDLWLVRELGFVELVAVVFGEELVLELVCDGFADVLVLAACGTHSNQKYLL